MKTMLTLYFLIFGSLALAESHGSIEVRQPVIQQNLVVLNAALVAESDRLALLGELAVVDKTAAGGYAVRASKSRGLLVVRNPMTGEFGTSDGGIIIRTRAGESLSVIAADYGLALKHQFTALPMGVLMPTNISAVPRYIKALRTDSRITSVDLDVNFYSVKAN